MHFQNFETIRYYQFPSLQDTGVLQALFTRKGGVSPEPWKSLNLGGTVGDERTNVIENRRRCFESMGRPVESIFDVWQVHSADVVCADTPRRLDAPHQKADIIFTDREEITLMMRFADCVPILFVDPVRRVVGMAHAGWQGTVKRVAEVAVQSMQARYSSKPDNILAGIGPSICVDHYPVGPEVVEAVHRSFGSDANLLIQKRGSETHFNLWEANRLTLEQAGVRKIEISGLCTAAHPEDWYSHRGEKGQTGRFGAIVALKGGNGWKPT